MALHPNCSTLMMHPKLAAENHPLPVWKRLPQCHFPAHPASHLLVAPWLRKPMGGLLQGRSQKSLENWELAKVVSSIIKSNRIWSDHHYHEGRVRCIFRMHQKAWDPSVWHLTPPALGGDKLQDISSDCEGVVDGTFIACANQQSSPVMSCHVPSPFVIWIRTFWQIWQSLT